MLSLILIKSNTWCLPTTEKQHPYLQETTHMCWQLIDLGLLQVPMRALGWNMKVQDIICWVQNRGSVALEVAVQRLGLCPHLCDLLGGYLDGMLFLAAVIQGGSVQMLVMKAG